MDWIQRHEDGKTWTVYIQTHTLECLVLSDIKQRQVGFLNFLHIPRHYGLVLKNPFILHSRGLFEPICVLFITDQETLCGKAQLAPNQWIRSPWKSRWAIECHSDYFSQIETSVLKTHTFHSWLPKILHVFWYGIILWFPCLWSDTIKLYLHEEIIYEFHSPMNSIHVSRPDIVHFTPIGLTRQTIKLKGLKIGEALLFTQNMQGESEKHTIIVSNLVSSTKIIPSPPQVPPQSSIHEKIKNQITETRLNIYLKNTDSLVIGGLISQLKDYQNFILNIAFPYHHLFINQVQILESILPQTASWLQEQLKQEGLPVVCFLKGHTLFCHLTEGSWEQHTEWTNLIKACFPHVFFSKQNKNTHPINVEIKTFIYENHQNQNDKLGLNWAINGPLAGIHWTPHIEIKNKTAKVDFQIQSILPLDLFLDLFKGSEHLQTLAAPTLIMKPNTTGFIHAGGEITWKNSSNTKDTPHILHTKPWGLMIEAHPSLIDESYLLLDFKLTNHTSPQTNEDGYLSFYSTEMRSSIILPFEHVAAFGGLQMTVQDHQFVKFPILGEIPILGHLFQHKIKILRDKILHFAISAKKLHQLDRAYPENWEVIN